MSNILNILRAICGFLHKVKDVTFPLIINGKRPRRSIVRYIGSNLPIPCPKVHIYVPQWRHPLEKKLSQVTICSEVSSTTIGDSASRGECEIFCDCSDISCPHETRFAQLQNELQELREQVAANLLNRELQELREQVAAIVLKQNSPSPGEGDGHALPPPPPPPPPPLPLSFNASPFVTPKRKPLATKNDNVDNPDLLSNVLKEIKSGPPKLKPIERSPGGRPVKRPKLINDPSDILAEVLRKRFIAVHLSSDTNDSDTSQPDVISPDVDWNNTCFV